MTPDEIREIAYNLNLGATSEYPHGKVNDEDQGELRAALVNDRDSDTVIMVFGKPVAWLSMQPEQAEALGRLMLVKAGEAMNRRRIKAEFPHYNTKGQSE